MRYDQHWQEQFERLAYRIGREKAIVAIAHKLLELFGKTNLKPEHRPCRPSDVDRHFASVSKAQSLFQFRPAMPIDEGLPLYVDWFRKTHPEANRLLEDVRDQNW